MSGSDDYPSFPLPWHAFIAMNYGCFCCRWGLPPRVELPIEKSVWRWHVILHSLWHFGFDMVWIHVPNPEPIRASIGSSTKRSFSRRHEVYPKGPFVHYIYIRIHSIYIYIINIVCIYIHSIYYDYIYIYKYPPLYPHLAVNSFHCGPAWNCWFPEAELQGDGLARQRGAIIDGLRTAVLERSVAGNMSCPYFVTTRLPSGNQAWRWNPPNSFRWFSC